jgi:hypothetical protein
LSFLESFSSDIHIETLLIHDNGVFECLLTSFSVIVIPFRCGFRMVITITPIRYRWNAKKWSHGLGFDLIRSFITLTASDLFFGVKATVKTAKSHEKSQIWKNFWVKTISHHFTKIFSVGNLLQRSNYVRNEGQSSFSFWFSHSSETLLRFFYFREPKPHF